MPSDDLLGQAFALASDAVGQARSSLMVQAPFLDVALWRMPFAAKLLGVPLASDGRVLFIDASALIRSYQSSANEVLRDYLHCILHCVFRHPFDSKHVHETVWDVACDVCVEAIALELVGAGFPSARDEQRMQVLERLRHACPQLTAHKIYKAILPFAIDAEEKPDNGLTRDVVASLPELFKRDDHGGWPRAELRQSARTRLLGDTLLMPSDGNERVVGDNMQGDDEEEKERSAGIDSPGAPAPSSSSTAVEADIENGDALVDMPSSEKGEPTFESMDGVSYADFESITWQDISKQIEMDLEAFTGKIGSSTGNLMVNLSVANRKRYDYRDFLKRFSSLSEEMKISTEEFDYIPYVFGLNHYENMPLVEPLEYQESDRVRDFVIAIDTSASCAGALVQQFAEKTYDVLKNTEGFGRKVNIHIVQCDCDIRSDTKITEMRDFEKAFEEFHSQGYGGTDFRPVFRYVDDLIEAREFTNLKGLIYFTDGLGKYPDAPPGYETVFVFVDEEDKRRKVPPWAMKVVMDEDDIREL